jgi:hypothetical protein
MLALVRQHAKERAEWIAREDRLLDRIMLLADKPMVVDQPFSPDVDEDDDFVFGNSENLMEA